MKVPLDPTTEYIPSEIVKYGFILNTKGKPDYRYVLRLIESGKLRARNVCRGKGKYYKVLGDDILTWKKGTYTVPEQEPYKPGARGARPFPQPPEETLT